MRDFTLSAYREYLKAIVQNYNIIAIKDLIPMRGYSGYFCCIRHDVDRKPLNALKMAEIESDAGVSATYYFRIKKNVFNPDIIKRIHELGHDIGYHYEELSDANGDMDKALKLFEKNLETMRSIVPVATIAMHGRPFKPYDNRDLWRNEQNHLLLLNHLKISGEVYLDIDYSNIAYINDTGRNWESSKSNLRDRVDSSISADFISDRDLLSALLQKKYSRIFFQIHPERWSNGLIEWSLQSCKDSVTNLLKKMLG